jgi:hypothetical protein
MRKTGKGSPESCPARREHETNRGVRALLIG